MIFEMFNAKKQKKVAVEILENSYFRKQGPPPRKKPGYVSNGFW